MRTDVEFPSADGTRTLRGTAHVPDDADGPVPAVVVSPGFGDVVARLQPVVDALLAAGLGVLAYDHGTFGLSDGVPRQEVDPVAQHRDLRMAVTVVQHQEGLDPDRIGLWGISFSGAHVLTAAAWDRRVKAVVSQVPWIAGRENVLRMGGEQALATFGALLDRERESLVDGAAPSRVTIARRTDDDSPGFALFSDDESAAYFESGLAGVPVPWENTVTVRSIASVQEYDVRPLAPLVSPTPLLLVVARHDTAMPADLAIGFHDAALEPKELVVVDGGHYDLYPAGDAFDQAMDVTTRWFTKHL
ncbi:alpha/beta hydrolase [Amycolatopsis sp. cmx-4-61]|uniref:alpha/beta hydrolase n=1 Tax=Amycolatopsis sp. cmx-4-61 TaxID=2790937 RepID=UPI00397E8064